MDISLKTEKELQKMKKVELIEYINELHEDIQKRRQNTLELINETVWLEHEINKLKEKLKEGYKGGRKKKFNQEQAELIKQARKENKSVRTIAKEFGCSVGLVHKIIKDIDCEDEEC